jgi:hypothetical protein
MRDRITSHLRGNAVAYLALFTALGGSSYAAVTLAPGSVNSRALAKGAVTHSKLAAHSVGAANFTPGALQSALGVKPGAKGSAGGNGAGAAKGQAGAVGPQGPAGHDGSASVAFRARSTGSVTGPAGASTTIPLAGSWTQAANDLNLLTGSITIAIPQACTGSYGNAVVMSVDGVPNTFAIAPTAPANTTVTVPLVVSELMEPGAATQHTLTAKLMNSCTKSGEDYTLTDAKLDVVNFR